MYKCKKCNNITEFEEQNVIKTYIEQNNAGDICFTSDEFFYREDIICLECGATYNDKDVIETYKNK